MQKGVLYNEAKKASPCIRNFSFFFCKIVRIRLFPNAVNFLRKTISRFAESPRDLRGLNASASVKTLRLGFRKVFRPALRLEKAGCSFARLRRRRFTAASHFAPPRKPTFPPSGSLALPQLQSPLRVAFVAGSTATYAGSVRTPHGCVPAGRSQARRPLRGARYRARRRLTAAPLRLSIASCASAVHRQASNLGFAAAPGGMSYGGVA